MAVEPAGFADGLDVEKREREGSRSGMALRIGLEELDTSGERGDLGTSSWAAGVKSSVGHAKPST